MDLLRCKTFQELRAELLASPDPLQRPLDMVGSSTYAPLAWTVPGVYRLRVADPESPLFGEQYVGAAQNVRKRMMEHLWRGQVHWADRHDILCSQMEVRALSLFPNGISRSDLADAEVHWMQLLKPSLNKHWRRGYKNAKPHLHPCPPPYQEHFRLLAL